MSALLTNILSGALTSSLIVALIQLIPAMFPKKASKIERQDAQIKQAVEVTQASTEFMDRILEHDKRVSADLDKLNNEVVGLRARIVRLEQDLATVFAEWNKRLPGVAFPIAFPPYGGGSTSQGSGSLSDTSRK